MPDDPGRSIRRVSQRVRVEIGGDGVAQVVMARPERHNALDEAQFRGLHAAADRLAAEPALRAVVLHGEGPSFCSGLDVASFASGDGMDFGDVLAREPGRSANWVQRTAIDWAELEVPVIAAVHGVCFGGGLQIALGADLRIAAPDARLSVMEVKWGLIPDMGITQTLAGLVRRDVAAELTWTGREVDGAEAVGLGLVTEIVPDPLARALELARVIAARSPDAVRRAKALYAQAPFLTREQALALEAELQHELLGGANQREAVRAAMAQEPGRFLDPTPIAVA